MPRTIIFDKYSPPANVYEYRMDEMGGTHLVSKKGKNMENVKTIDDTIVDAVALPTIEDLDATLAVKSDENGEPIIFTQSAEDTEPFVPAEV